MFKENRRELKLMRIQFGKTNRRTDGSRGVNPRAGDSKFWCTWTTCLANSRSLSMSARSRISHRRSKRDNKAGGRLIFSAGVLRRSYRPLQK